MGLWEAATRVTDWPALLNLLRQELDWPLPDSFSWDCTFAWSDNDLQLAPLQASLLEGGQVRSPRLPNRRPKNGRFLPRAVSFLRYGE